MKYAAYWVAGRIFLLERTLSRVERQDVLDTLLFALLSADNLTPDESRFRQWFEEWSDGLQACGWSLREQQFASVLEPDEGSGIDGPVCDALFNVFADQLSSHQKACFSHALKTAVSVTQAFPEPPPITPGRRGRADMGLVQASGILKCASIYFSDGQNFNHRDVADGVSQVELRGDVSGSYLSARLNVEAYHRYKEPIAQSLNGKRDSQIKDLGDV